ncbi:MAG: 3-hydroxybutyryl-CoA dehydrogenase [Deltaproteobacteria bacterium]|nr:3-hydroxybutyryl-CoA dehydrogenase [Deltaproteobacteria bacterium]
MSTIAVFGVIGAGQMGQGIAQVAAQTGCQVLLLDASPELAEQGLKRIERAVARLVEKGKVSSPDGEAIVSRVKPAGDYAVLADADFVIEAATEEIELKQKLFQSADRVMKEGAILASNTSSISLTKLAAVTSRPERVIGMHFMNPVPVMKLVEIVRALQTSDDTYQQTRDLGEKMGKTVVTTKDMPGFIVNRMLIPFLNEACFALQEGLGTPEDIDTGAKLGLNHPMGPLELADLIGLDTVLHITEVLQREIGEDKYRPPAILRNYVAAGWLGRKSGRGFYNYER